MFNAVISGFPLNSFYFQATKQALSPTVASWEVTISGGNSHPTPQPNPAGEGRLSPQPHATLPTPNPAL